MPPDRHEHPGWRTIDCRFSARSASTTPRCLAIDPAIVDIIGEEFIETYGQSFAALTTALDSGDLKPVELTAHTLKGLFATFGAMLPSCLAGEIEAAAREQRPEACRAHLLRLAEDGQAFCTALARHLAQPGHPE